MPPRPYRKEKLSHIVHEVLAEYLARNFSADDALVTIVDVDMEKDALHANVKVGIIPFEKAPKVWKELEDRRGEFEHMLLKKMRARVVPHLSFVIDNQSVL